MGNDNPKIRQDLEFLPAVRGQEQVMVVRDPLGITGRDVVLTNAGSILVSLLDGRRSIRDIQVELMRRQGSLLISSNDVEEMIMQLNKSFLLDNEQYRKERQHIVEEFSAMEYRPSSHVGSAYPQSADELTPWLDSMLEREEKAEQQKLPTEISALVAPHIDLRVGKRVYASAYGSLAGKYAARTADKPERIVILGTGHNLGDGLISLCEKDFVTPLGRAKTDVEVVKGLRASGSSAVASDDFAHRREHSIEFQVVFLQHVLRQPDIIIVPILFGSFHAILGQYRRALEIPGIGLLLSCLREIVLDSQKKTLIVAGVDLSHVGPKFGDSLSAVSYEPGVRAHDHALLEVLCALDAEAFWAEEQKTADRYHVCGFPVLACMLEILPPGKGELLSYEFWNEEATQFPKGSFRTGVSFAAVVFGTD